MSTLPTIKSRLLVLLNAALDVPCFYSWNPAVQAESVFLGRAIVAEGDRDQTTITYEYPTVEVNVPRFETYTIPVTVIAFHPEHTASGQVDTEARAFTLLDAALDAIDGADLGASVEVQSRPDRVEHEIGSFIAGWGVVLIIELRVTAHIT